MNRPSLSAQATVTGPHVVHHHQGAPADYVDDLTARDFRHALSGLYLSLSSRLSDLRHLRNTLRRKEWRARKDLEAAFARHDTEETKTLQHTRFHLLQAMPHCDDLIQRCQTYLSRLDTTETIDHAHPDRVKIKQFISNTTRKYLRKLYGLEKHFRSDTIEARVAEMLRLKGIQMRQSGFRSRLINALEDAHSQGWYMVFDTLTIRDQDFKAFEDQPNALRDHIRRIGRRVNLACGARARDSVAPNFQYFLVPEYGSKNGRLHFHAIYLMRKLPLGARDPNLNRPQANYREINALKGFPFGFSSPIAVRYTGDAFTLAGWRWPTQLDKKTGQYVAVPSKPCVAVAHYVTKYATKNMNEGSKQCQSKRHQYRIRMSRNFGMNLPPMDHLPSQDLQILINLHLHPPHKKRAIIWNSSKLLRERMSGITLQTLLASRTPRISLFTHLVNSTQKTPNSNPQNSSLGSPTRNFLAEELSSAGQQYLEDLFERSRRTRDHLSGR